MSEREVGELALLRAEVERLGHESRMWRGEARIRGMRQAGQILQEAKEVRYAMSQAKTRSQWDETYSKMELFLQLCENSIGEYFDAHGGA